MCHSLHSLRVMTHQWGNAQALADRTQRTRTVSLNYCSDSLIFPPSIRTVHEVEGRSGVMRERIAYQVDCVVVQNTSGSTFWKTNRASPCKYHAPDPNTNPDPNPSPNADPNHNYRDVVVSIRSTWYAVLSRITAVQRQALFSLFSSLLLLPLFFSFL